MTEEQYYDAIEHDVLLLLYVHGARKDIAGMHVAKHGAVALRLALYAGACIDLDEIQAAEPTVCLSARWDGAEEAFKLVLDNHPQAYVTVREDVSSAIVAAPKSTAMSLIRELEEKGIKVQHVDREGQFYHLTNNYVCRKLSDFCASLPMLHFNAQSRHLAPLRIHGIAEVVLDEIPPHETALRCALLERAEWHATLTEAVAAATREAAEPRVLLLGPVNCIPESARTKVLRPREISYVYPEHSIAIVGASCRFAGAETPSRLWETILAKRSTLRTPPQGRGYPSKESGEEDQFWGHFLDKADSFDHAFFRKSPREALYMDPQQRLALELAYEALESGGYFSQASGTATDDVGCYVGVQSSDYEENVNARPPTAFSFTGTARAFVSGRISYFFGWTGPSLVIDTGCSSSGVAIHTACRAIQSGECSMALAGGVNVMTSPKSHQNLAAATMRSRTGHCNPFDAGADGYCRGEGGGFVLLKRLSSAVADNDRILGVLAGSRINNSKGSLSITAPSADSHEALFRSVLQQAGMHPTQVSYVEAHGTGTQRGDPVECDSIRRVFGGSSRKGGPLRFGSVKANIGHTEGASGLASLIKVLLMLQHRQIAPQTSFSMLNPAVPSLEEANMEIPLRPQPWEAPFRAAFVNNYGAAGSNTAMVVCQPPSTQAVSLPVLKEKATKYPFLITAHSEESLRQYCRVLLKFIEAQYTVYGDALLASLAFHSAQRQNHQLGFRKAFSAASIDELRAFLSEGAVQSQNGSKPVVLVFAGQTGQHPRLSEEAYRSSFLLQHHLNRCDRALQSLGLRGLFPHVFGTEPTGDLCDLHCMQFSIQYASAMSWIDAGLHIETAVGHSLGQLTALCVAGVLSLRDGLKMISGRASLIQRKWGQERGCMLSVSSDVPTVQAMIKSTIGDGKAEIACFNSASSQVVAGTLEAITTIEDAACSAGIRTKRLAITHAFHSPMVDSIMEEYENLLQELEFHLPAFPVEPCAKSPNSWANITPDLVARQSREPVYFADAIGRIEQRLGPCVWLEAGSAPAGVIMARRALAAHQPARSPTHTFYSAQLDNRDVMDSLTSTTLSLWSEGVRVQFWPFHALQRHCFLTLELPPYQFESTHHWLPWVDTSEKPTERHQRQEEITAAPQLVSFVRYLDGTRPDAAEFSINQDSEEYSTFVRGRTVLGHILCPPSVYLESAIRALSFLPVPFAAPSAGTPEVEQLQLHAPLGLNPNQRLRLKLHKRTASAWDFTVSSHWLGQDEDRTATLQASGTIKSQQQNNAEPGPYRPLLHRLIDYERCQRLREDPSASVAQGAFVKKVLDRVASYDESYFGIRSITSKGSEAVATVEIPAIASQRCDGTRVNPPVFDNFTLLAEVHAGNLDEDADDQVYVCGGIDAVIPHAKYGSSESSALRGPFTVYSRLDRASNRALVGDIFVLAADHKTLCLSILGARFSKIPIRSLQKALQAANGPAEAHPKGRSDQSGFVRERQDSLVFAPPTERDVSSWDSSKISIIETKSAIMNIFHETTGVPSERLEDDTSLTDLGVDSLMATELQARIKYELHVELPSGKFWEQEISFGQLCRRIFSRLDMRAESVSDVPQLTPGDTDDSSDSSFASKSPPPIRMNPLKEKGLIVELSHMLAEHLNCSTTVPPDTPLALMGLDSLVAIELKSDLERRFGKKSNHMRIDETTTLSDLCQTILAGESPKRQEPRVEELTRNEPTAHGSVNRNDTSTVVAAVEPPLFQGERLTRTFATEFAHVKQKYSSTAQETGFAGFYSGVYQRQMSLVLSYIVEASKSLGCDLTTLRAGEQLPPVPCIPKYQKLIHRYMQVLEDAGLVSPRPDHSSDFLRTANPLPQTASSDAHDAILAELPAYRPEHQLLHVTGSRLADCLAGKADPLQLLFSSAASRQLLEDVYVRSPMFATGTKLLGDLLCRVLRARRDAARNGAPLPPTEKLRVLEIGAGTGATTYHVIDRLQASGLADAVSYTFTDISPSLVAGARRKFEARYGAGQLDGLLEFAVLDIERPSPASASQAYDVVISSNCIHATKSLPRSCENIRRLLRSDGVLCLLELTRPLPWLDCVFGLLDGWWRFEDDREYVLADERRWERVLLDARFQQVDWTDDESRESEQFRLIITWFTSE
ncbi:hypothetical protein B0J12DRAFT_770787 [Macrophomina phaseolina]|uniref:Beta-ketoacyl synthase n=1 Tax=Macrophomina phaseolina TaxID=35725 RepID=A0ABQ8FX40_9PEZI|nr:hypothetical protein B0J12DRAFT_770787 [Macrophomina phaseolina]